MFQHLRHFGKLVLLGTVLLSPLRTAYGDGEYPIEITLPATVEAGTYQLCTLTSPGEGTGYFSSDPPGVVSATFSVSTGSNLLSIPFSFGYSGPVTIYATINGSTQLVGTTTIVVPS